MTLWTPTRPTISRYDQIMAYNLKVGLVSMWPLDEAAGTRLDHSGLGSNLTDNNTVTGNPGPSIFLPLSSQFTRVNSEYLSIADNTALSMGNIDCTFACWAYFDTLPGVGETYMLMGKWTGGGAPDREYILSAEIAAGVNYLALTVRDTTDLNNTERRATTFGAPGTTTWYFIVAWYDLGAGTLNIQVNDGTVDSSAYTGGVRDGGSLFTFGAMGQAANFHNGRIADGAIWKRVLTAQERTWLYNGGAGRSLSQLRLAA